MEELKQFLLLDTPPEQSPEEMWRLQLVLLKYAESHFGTRSGKKILYRPDFDIDGPFVRHTPKYDGAFADLSFGSKSSWDCALNEIAHETVHLLDPRGTSKPAPKSSNFEEAVATAFAMHCSELAGGTYRAPSRNYAIALAHTSSFTSNIFTVAYAVRRSFGHFSAPSAADFLSLEINGLSNESAKLLADTFPGRGY